jgi:hypothetical protein
MKLMLRRIRNVGELDRERIVFRARYNLDLGDYSIFRAKAKNDEVYAVVSHTFWFPDSAAKEGDLVIVYTKAGKQRRKDNEDGSSSHFFYWGLEAPLWNTSTFAPVILEIASWNAFFEKDIEE